LRVWFNRKVGATASPRGRTAATVAALAASALILATAVIHLHLWLSGYRHVPRLGPLFIGQAVAGLVLAPVLAWARTTLVVAVGCVYMAASAVGLLLSATVGFVGVHDSLSVPWAAWSLATELAGSVLLGGVLALQAWTSR
jgi:hypothetical protein